MNPIKPPRSGWPAPIWRIRQLERSGMMMLLVLLVVTVFVVPVVLPSGHAERLALDILMTFVLLSGVVAVVEYRRAAIALAVLSVITIALRWSGWFVSVEVLPTLRMASDFAALLILACAVGITVFFSNRAVAARIIGAVVLYLLIGLLWGVAYLALDTFRPDAFAGPNGEERGMVYWVYFSFVTLTTLGYGDITPLARTARSLAICEALIGQLYPAIILGRLLSLPTGERFSPDVPPKGPGSA